MRRPILALLLACGALSAASAQVSVGIGVNLPGVSIGVNVPAYPQLVRVPGYPVYYAPGMDTNFFFYDGMYWVYQSDNWYASSWYNGPWSPVGPEYVPVYVLRVPVSYYRAPPVYFRGWRRDAPPRWDDHWGPGWSQQHRGWDHWNRGAVPPPAPLPVYQRQYNGNRYPPVEQQRALQGQNYRYQPRDAVVRQHFQPAAPRAEVPPPPSRGGPMAPAERAPQGRPAPPQAVPHQQPQAQPAPMRPEPPAARAPNERERGPAQAPQQERRGQGQAQEREHGRGEGRGPDKRE